MVFTQDPERIRLVSVTDFEKEKSSHLASVQAPIESGYLQRIDGVTKGTIIHEVLRGCDARVVCQEYGVDDPEAVRQCEEIVTRFRGSELIKRVKREFCELPFVITFEGKRVTGKIDRLCELEDGSWVVIDYKSDPVSLLAYPLKGRRARGFREGVCGGSEAHSCGKEG
jgi:ATP-dependent exoDNAse (exonuclease V) beta subunit